MADDGSRDRGVAALYLKLAESYNNNDTNGVIIYKSRIEKEERHKINEDTHSLYSHKQGKILSFSSKVLELNEMYQDLIYELSENSNERMRDLKDFTTEEIMYFNKRVTEKLRRKSKQM